jgi:pyridoxine kinase
MSDNIRVVAITSLPTVGNAGLKNMIPLLGTYIIPVPTLLLSGLGNMEGHQKFELPFEEILNETLKMVEKQNYRLVVYVGYLRNAEQIDSIAEAISNYDHIIDCVVVDPICGDAGKAYVDQTIIDGYPKLLNLANIAIPNKTEVRLLNGADFNSDLSELQQRMQQDCSDQILITTGIQVSGKIHNQIISRAEQFETQHNWFDKQVSGTGDAFAALFIWHYFIKQKEIKTAVQLAGDTLSEMIEAIQTSGKEELHISISTFSIDPFKQTSHE